MKRYYYMSKLTGMVHLSNKPLSADNWTEISYALYMLELPNNAKKYAYAFQHK